MLVLRNFAVCSARGGGGERRVAATGGLHQTPVNANNNKTVVCYPPVVFARALPRPNLPSISLLLLAERGRRRRPHSN